MSKMCLVVTPEIRKLADEITKAYPQASQRASFSTDMCAEWIGAYNEANSKSPDFVPDMKSLVGFVEKHRNMDGKSFLYVSESITYNLPGQKQQTYSVIGSKIFNKAGKEVFSEDSKHRHKIFANLAVQQGRAVVVEHKGKKYVVNGRNQIISVTTGDMMQWGEENGDRKAILALSKAAFDAKQKVETTTDNIKGENISSGGSAFAKMLTNPGNNLQVVYKGKTFRNAEHAYQTWKSGEFDEVAFNSNAFKPRGSKPVNKSTNYQTMVEILIAKLQQHPELVDGIKERGGEAYLKTSTHSVTGDAYWESAGQNKFIEALTEAFNTINSSNQRSNNNILTISENEYTDEFRRVQEESSRMASEELSQRHRGEKSLTKDDKQRLGVLYGRLVSRGNGRGYERRSLTAPKSGNTFDVIQVNGSLFHDIFEVNRRYLRNGELVDLHEDYTGCKCFITDDGLCGFAIEPNGNLVSVFSLWGDDKKGFLHSIKDYIIEQGATHLDAYNSPQQPLANIYQKVFGAKVASSMDYNMEYDHDDISQNHGNPDVVFMIMGKSAEKEIEEKHFDGNQYDEAVEWQHANIDVEAPADLAQNSVSLNTINSNTSRSSNMEEQSIEQTLNDFINGKRQFNNLSAEENDTARGDRLLAAAEVATRLHGRSNQEESQDDRNDRQERQVEEWAKSAGIWHEDALSFGESFGEEMKGGQESHVYENLPNKSVIKVKNTTQYHDLQEFLDGIILHNTLFPETAYKVVGFGNDGDGFVAILEQPFVLGTVPTQEQIDGFVKSVAPDSEKYEAELKNGRYKTLQTLLHDLSPKNAIITPGGNIAIIDAIIRPNVASEGKGGQRSNDYSIGTVSPSSSPSDAASVDVGNTDNLAATATGFTLSDQEKAAAQRRQEQANKPKPERPKSVAYESALKPNDSRMAQFKRVFSPQQIKDRGAMISNIFSNILDDAVMDEIDSLLDVVEDEAASEESKTQARQRINALRDPVNGRQLAAQALGIPQIINMIKEEIHIYMNYADESTKPLYQNTLDYFEELFNTQATLDIEEREGIRIIGLSVAEQTATEDENDAQNDGDDEVGHTVSGSDGWNFQVRYEDPFNSLSKKVRSMLYDVKRPDSEVDDLGQTRKYPMGQIYASLLSYLSKNMQSPDDFIQIDKSFEGQDNWGNDITEFTYPNGYPTFPVLEKMRTTYPWIEQIIQRLTDDYLRPDWNSNLRYPSTGGTMASQFYTNFRKAYIPYGKVQVGNSNFGVTPLNYQMEERAQYDKLEANYNNRMILTDTSIYNPDGKVNRENARKLEAMARNAAGETQRFYDIPSLMEYHSQHPEEEVLTPEDIQEYNQFIDNVRNILQSYGIDATQDAVVTYLQMDEGGKALHGMLADLEWIASTIGNLSDDRIDGFNYITDTRDRYGSNLWSHFFDGRGMITDASYMQSFYDSASHKTKYSYSADNYLMKTFRGACMGTLAERRAYIDEHFSKFEWFKNQKTGEWRNKWLEYWYNFEDEVKEIPYRNIDNVTEYGEKGTIIRQYSKWTPDDVWQVQDRNFDPEGKKKDAYYLAPIFSDSPMSMTVRGPKMNMEHLLYGYTDDKGIRHQGAFVQLVNQELWRIQYVQQRAKAIEEGRVKPISNFDGKRGQQFCFMPELNNYVFEDTGETFLQRMLRLKNEKATLQEIEQAQIQAIKAAMTRKMAEYQVENGIHYKKNPLSEEQYYNMTYANAAIIQMTTIDLAYYKNDTDFQKRFKEVYAGGIQLNTNSKYGKKTENIVLLSDDIITSPSYDKITAIIDKSNTLSQADKESIKASFTDINVADAQAIRAMHSFRSVLDMMGKWDDTMEEALNRFKQGTWNKEDFDVIYQTIKPFVYAVIERNDGFGGTIPVPQQNKNSEICALMMYDLITNGLNNSPVYKALSRFMEDNVDGDGNHLIDMIQFESAGKVGNQGVINISFNPEKVMSVIDNGVTVGGKDWEFLTDETDNNVFAPNDLEHAEDNYKAIKWQLDFKLENGEISQDSYNKIMDYLRPTEDEIISMLEQMVLVTNPDGTKGINPEVVHTIPFDNYYQQQLTPEHHIDAEATFGSQARNIAVADLPDNFEITLPGRKGSKTFKGKDALIDFYYELLNENLIEDFFGKGKNGGLKGVFASKESLRDAVTEIVRGNPKYGRDFAEALQLDDNGNFVLSPNSPTMFNLMQELVTSFFKNRITKQTINGAALIQAAGIGLDKDLHMVFDGDGKLLGAECYMPLTTKKFFEPLLETKIINGQQVQVLSPKKLKQAGLDRAVGYRIPTENKSSMMPLIIKDFTPLQNGSAIVLPAEITDIAGSDFDVDKMFIMLLSFSIQNYDMGKARNDFAKQNAVADEIFNMFTKSQLAEEILDEDPQDFKEWFEENKEDYLLKEPRIHKIEYDFKKSPKENGRKARNNMLIQMIYGILTSKEGSESLLNPQGFKDVKRAAKITRILTDPNLREALMRNTEGNTIPGVMPSAETILAEFLNLVQEKYPNKYEQFKQAVQKMTTEQIQQAYIQAVTAGNKTDAVQMLMDSSTKDLEKFIADYSPAESPIYPQTFAHSHARNMAGANQIGIYAIQGSMTTKYQRANTTLRQEQRFTVNGREISNVDVSDGGRRFKNVGQMLGASADNGKDPNLSDMGSTTKTAPMIGYMLRSGLSIMEAALIINQPHIEESRFSSKNYKYWKNILGKNPLATETGNVTTDMLIRSIMSPFELDPEEDKAIAALCYRILCQHEAMEYMTQISRADSPNGAMQNTYAKARIQQYKVDLFQAKMGQKDFPFIRIKEALSNTAIDTAASEDEVREQLKGQRMAFLHGMYALGINSFQNLVAPYFFGANKHFDESIVKPILYNLNERLSDAEKEKIVNNIYTSYITYMLSGSPLFGNEEGSSMKSKKDYYLQTFPDDYIKVIQDNEDIRNLLSSVLQVRNFGSRKRVVLQDVGSLSKGQKQDVQRRFESLAYSDNPAARTLAKDLLIYSYFDNGLQFTHDSFSHLFTTEFLTNFPEYTETLNDLNRELSPAEEENFIAQFLVTYNEAAYNVNNIITSDNVNKGAGRIVIDLNKPQMRKRMINEVMSPNPLSEGINVYPYIYYQGDVYMLDKDLFDQFPGNPVYHRVPQYDTYSRLPLFNIGMSVTQMAQEFPIEEGGFQNEIPDVGSVEAPAAPNDSNEDPAVDNSMQAAFDAMDDFEAPDWEDAPEPQSEGESYQNEGQGELLDPFCE